MSLLLDALRKAEKAKEAAKGGAKSKAPSEGGLSLEPAVEEAKRVMTRDKLPDISAPLEIGSEDLAPRQSAVPPMESAAPLAASATPPDSAAVSGAGAGRPARPPAGSGSGGPAARRAAAQSMLQAKYKEPNPKVPFYITLGVLGVFAIGTVVYFYIQLRPRPPLVNANPQPSGEQVQVAQSAPAAPTPRAPTPRAPSAQTIPGLPSAAPSVPPATAPGSQPAPAAQSAPRETAPASAQATAPAAQTPKPRPETPAPSPAANASRPAPSPSAGISRTSPQTRATSTRPFGRRSVARVNPGVAAGYAAYEAGDLAGARRGYQQALRSEPRNIDALLGMAAVELRAGKFAGADHYYRQVLRLDPRNPYANAGMLALRNRQVNPVAAESQVKNLMASEPGAETLQFTLGNQYAQQGRWNEAQQAYFKALAADPKNADFAYNLAVSLDHLRQVNPALQHYRLALKLAETRGAGFDVNMVRARIAQLAH
ncbi:MAG: tetratricopeptide repeat protein [Burkholderiales bacterium]